MTRNGISSPDRNRTGIKILFRKPDRIGPDQGRSGPETGPEPEQIFNMNFRVGFFKNFMFLSCGADKCSRHEKLEILAKRSSFFLKKVFFQYFRTQDVTSPMPQVDEKKLYKSIYFHFI